MLSATNSKHRLMKLLLHIFLLQESEENYYYFTNLWEILPVYNLCFSSYVQKLTIKVGQIIPPDILDDFPFSLNR